MADRLKLTKQQRDAVLREAGYRCAIPTCHTTLAIDVHHIIQVRDGGGNELPNLLALCPTCHALFHRGVISRESIKEYKNRIATLNQVIDVEKEIEARKQRIVQSAVEEKPDLSPRVGFAMAAGEYVWRTCPVGFRYDEKMFVATGFCCFIGQRLAVTSAEAVKYAVEVGNARGGFPVISTQIGLAPFTVRETEEDGNLAVIEMGKIDDEYVKKLLSKNPDIAAHFAEPLQTRPRFRIVPYVGERVGLMHYSSTTNQHRTQSELQFDTADVSFPLTTRRAADFLVFVLSPLLSHMQHRGAPAFSETAELVGIVRETLLLDNETAWRPVICSLLPILKYLKP